MTTLIKLCLSLSLIFTSPYAFGDEAKSGGDCDIQINCTIQQGNTTTTTTTPTMSAGGTQITNGVSGLTSTTTTTNYGSAGTSGSGAYTQAQNAKNKANGTMIAAFAMAAMLAAMCGPHNITPCILAPIAAMAGMMAGQKKDQAQQVMENLGTSDTTAGTKDTTGTTDGTDQAKVELAKIKADLAKKGYAMNADGSTTLPNGSTVASDLNSKSLQASGLSPEQISSINKEIEKMKKDLGNAEGSDGGAASIATAGYSGGRSRLGGDDYGGGESKNTNTAEADRTSLDRNPAAWQGYSTPFGDSQIGVPLSDLFLMVEKRVESERKVMGQ
jgi:hypothetical protein